MRQTLSDLNTLLRQTVMDARCPPGFSFNQPLQVCDDIDECYQGLDDCLEGTVYILGK